MHCIMFALTNNKQIESMITNITKKKYEPKLGTLTRKVYDIKVESSRRFDIQHLDSLSVIIPRLQRRTGFKYTTRRTEKRFIVTRIA